MLVDPNVEAACVPQRGCPSLGRVLNGCTVEGDLTQGSEVQVLHSEGLALSLVSVLLTSRRWMRGL